MSQERLVSRSSVIKRTMVGVGTLAASSAILIGCGNSKEKDLQKEVKLFSEQLIKPDADELGSDVINLADKPGSEFKVENDPQNPNLVHVVFSRSVGKNALEGVSLEYKMTGDKTNPLSVVDAKISIRNGNPETSWNYNKPYLSQYEISAPGFGPDAKADQWSVSYSGVCLNYDVDPNMYQSFSQTPGCDLTNLYRSSKLKGNDFTQSPEQANFLLSAAEEAFDGVLSTK